jgi:hypothetical protein
MHEPTKLHDRDAAVSAALVGITGVFRRGHFEKDRRGLWFANNQLDDLRKVLERMGYETARVFQRGKLEKSGNQWERKRSEILLQILDVLGETTLDIITCSYILGKLNSIIDEFEPRRADNVKRS